MTLHLPPPPRAITLTSPHTGRVVYVVTFFTAPVSRIHRSRYHHVALNPSLLLQPIMSDLNHSHIDHSVFYLLIIQF